MAIRFMNSWEWKWNIANVRIRKLPLWIQPKMILSEHKIWIERPFNWFFVSQKHPNFDSNNCLNDSFLVCAHWISETTSLITFSKIHMHIIAMWLYLLRTAYRMVCPSRWAFFRSQHTVLPCFVINWFVLYANSSLCTSDQVFQLFHSKLLRR